MKNADAAEPRSRKRSRQTAAPVEGKTRSARTAAPSPKAPDDDAAVVKTGAAPVTIAAGTTPAFAQSKVPARLQDTFVDERNDVLAVINELEDQLDRHQENREKLERELSSQSEKLHEANQRNQELEWQIAALQVRIEGFGQIQSELTVVEQELGDANADKHRISEQLAESERECARTKAELKTATKELDGLWSVRKERDGLHADCKALAVKVDELERAQQDLIEDRASALAQLRDVTTTMEEFRDERGRLDESLRNAADRVHELTQLEESLSDKIDALRVEKKNLQAQVVHLERENNRLAEQRQFYESEVTTLRNQNRTTETALNGVRKAFAEVRAALAETKTRARRREMDVWPRSGATVTTSTNRTADEEVPTPAEASIDHEEIPSLEPIDDAD